MASMVMVKNRLSIAVHEERPFSRTLPRSNKFQFRRPSRLIRQSSGRIFENGKIAQARCSSACMWASERLSFTILRPSEGVSRGPYLFYFLRVLVAPSTQATSRRCTGAEPVLVWVPAKLFRFFHRSPIPPLAEQKRIARILDAAEALRAKRREALAQLDNSFPLHLPRHVRRPGHQSDEVGYIRSLAEVGEVRALETRHLEEACSEYYDGGTIPWVKSGELREELISGTGERIT